MRLLTVVTTELVGVIMSLVVTYARPIITLVMTL
jgi:hypothetical protein